MKHRFSQLIVGFTSFLMLVLLLVPQPAYAQQVVSDPTAVAQREAIEIRKKTELTLSETLLASALGSLVHAASYFSRKVAYDTAVYVSSGGKGQSALIFRDGFGDYLGKVGQDAAADAIGEFGRPFGLNLCQIPDLRVNLFIQIGIDSIYGSGGPTPTCNWQQFRDGWSAEAFQRTYGDIDNVGDFMAETFSTSLSVRQSDFGIALGAVAQVDRIVAQERTGNLYDRLEGEGFKPLTDLISGNVVTPAQVIKEETKVLTAKEQSERSLGQIAGVYGSGAKEILPQAASVFLNTLTSQLLDKALNKGLFPSSQRGSAGTDGLDYFSSRLQTNRELAREAFGFLVAEVPTLPQQPFDTITEFATCPNFPTIHNCVIDESFRQALVRSRLDTLTLQEAVDEGLLNGDWPIISPRRSENADLNCYERGFCYSNIQKLRKLRVLPLGFEIAAQVADPDNPPTLNEVMRRFYTDCVPLENDPTRIDPTRSREFCRLIDPNWVLRAPIARCELEGTGEMFSNQQTAERLQTCFDVSTCVDEDQDGTCDGTYGYCTKEENVWTLPGQSCSEAFATCRTLTNVNTRQIGSYLTRTLDANSCSENSVGCRAYSLVQTNSGWQATTQNTRDAIEAGATQAVYFNQNITAASAVCRADNVGCQAFIAGIQDADGVYIKDSESGLFAQDQQNYIYAQKAPDYLGCYDIDPNTAGTQYPTSAFEAQNATSQNPLCQNYASICVENEVGCEAFTPVALQNGASRVIGPAIPGKIGSDQLCNEQCVGYDSFRQLETVFDDAVFPVEFIPSQARSCPIEYAGCEEFTSLQAADEGGENREYYTDIAHCELPTDAANKSFVVWEGSVQEGFTIRRVNLVVVSAQDIDYYESLTTLQENNDALTQLREGSPKYSIDTDAELVSAFENCNEEVYSALIENPRGSEGDNLDCRALYDNEDNVYYRLMSKTVLSTTQCRTLRRTNTVLAVDSVLTNIEANQANPGALCESRGGFFDPQTSSCMRCKNGGTYQNGSCVYSTAATQNSSLSCQGPAADPDMYAGCRVYSGNDANNVEQLLETGFDSFEPLSDEPAELEAAKGVWQPANELRVVKEATHLGLHSLEVRTTEIIRPIPTSTLSANNIYTIQLWSRGIAQQLTIDIVDNNGVVLSNERSIAIDPTWQTYTIGPFTFDPTISLNQANLRIRRSSPDSVYFIDTISVTRGTDTALVRDSWKEQNGGLDVPLACDANPNDNLPGAALGCAAYEAQTTGRMHFATGFAELCRANAVGCAPVWDTFNTLEGEVEQAANGRIYNLSCEREAGDGNGAVSCQIDGGAHQCTILAGEDQCTIPGPIILDANQNVEDYADYIGESTLVIPADTDESQPLFLSLTPEHVCQEGEKGCQIAGQETAQTQGSNDASFTHTDVYIKNDPALYSDTLCGQNEVGCALFSDGEGQIIAKDPYIIGGLCQYTQEPNSQGQFGWFLAEVGTCSADSPNAGDLCKENTACGEAGVCTNIGGVACYPDQQTSGGEFELLSNGTQGYDGLVGMCPPEQNACREFVDPLDADTQYPAGRPYYRIFNDDLLSGVEECSEQFSQKEGCVLFNDTSNPIKQFNAQASLLASANNPQEPFGFVSPVSDQDNNTNILLRVERDRQCKEWLACKTYVTERLPNGQQQRLCYEYEKCIESQGGICTKWQTIDNLDFEPLTRDLYIERDVSWTGEEYSGYSLFNKFGLDTYTSFLTLRDSESDLTYIAHESPSEQYTGDFLELSCVQKNDGDICGFDDGGRCFSGECVYPVDGTVPSTIEQGDTAITQIRTYYTQSQCKSMPETNSPRDISNEQLALDVLTQEDDLLLGGRRDLPSNVCQGDNCSCEYKKVTYDNGQIDYWPLNETVIPPGVCSVGKVGYPCRTDSSCNVTNNGVVVTEGSCSIVTEIEQYVGTQGYCLEYDLSREIPGSPGEHPCLTWHPIGVSASKFDVYNANIEAGYTPTIDAVQADGQQRGGTLYCTASTDIASQPYDRMFGDFPIDWPYVRCDRILETASGVVSTRDNDNNSIPSYYQENAYQTNEYTVSHKLNPQDFAVSLAPSLYTLTAVGKDNVFNAATTQAFNQYVQGQPVLNNDYQYPALIHSLKNKLPFIVGLDRGDRPDLAYALTQLTNQQIGTIPEYAKYNICPSGWSEQNNEYYSVSTEHLYTEMQLWAWEELSPASVVLRVEAMTAYDGEAIAAADIVSRNDKTVSLDPDSQCGQLGNTCVPFHFMTAPALGLSEQSTLGYGTLMHPPRIFSDPSIRVALANVDSSAFYSYFQTDSRSNRRVSTHPLSPDKFDQDNAEGLLYKSDLEFRITEADLNKVYFVPIGYPKEAEGINPAFLSKDFAIDFSLLRSTESRAIGYTAEALVTDGHGDGGYINPNRTTNGGFVYSYVLDANDANGLVSFEHYADVQELEGIATESTASQMAIMNSERNKIQRRYVSVFFGNRPSVQREIYPPFVTANVVTNEFVPPSGVRNDPFSVECDVVQNEISNGVDDNGNSGTPSDSSVIGNWFAIGMDFNADGEFLGYIVRHCAGEDDDLSGNGGVQFATIADLNDQCVEAVEVYDTTKNPLRDNTNKALTGRVTKNSQYTVRALNKRVDGFSYDTANRPFGSLPFSFGSDPTQNSKALIDANLTYASNSGVPYSCVISESWLYLDRAPKQSNTTFNSCRALYENRTGDMRYDVNLLPTVSQLLLENDNSIDTQASRFGRLYLEDLFAKVYKIASLTFANEVEIKDVDQEQNQLTATELTTIERINTADRGVDFNAPNDVAYHAPYIYSLNTETCSSINNGTGRCTIGEYNNMTVNGRNGVATDYNNDGLMDEDTNSDGQPDAHIGVGSYGVNLQFFAFVDSNHMPIRRVMVDWQDNSPVLNQDRNGLYKNRKPLCDYNPIVTGRCSNNPELSCSDNSDCSFNPRLPFTTYSDAGYNDSSRWDQIANNPGIAGIVDNGVCEERFMSGDTIDEAFTNTDIAFGSSARACEEGYFDYDHTYTCDVIEQQTEGIGVQVSDISNLATQNQLRSKGLVGTDTVCVYKPRVQILDNMGWCNGSCALSTGNSYTTNIEGPSFDQNGIKTGDTTSIRLEEQRYEGCFDETPFGQFLVQEFCSDPLVDEYGDAWTYYQGLIIVIPE